VIDRAGPASSKLSARSKLGDLADIGGRSRSYGQAQALLIGQIAVVLSPIAFAFLTR